MKTPKNKKKIKKKERQSRSNKQKGGTTLEEFKQIYEDKDSLTIDNALLSSTKVAPADETDYQKVLYLVEEKKANVNAKDGRYNTPLIFAAAETQDITDEEGNIRTGFIDFPEYKIISLLIKNGADIRVVNDDTHTALSITDNKEIQKLLIYELMKQHDDYYSHPYMITHQLFPFWALKIGKNDNIDMENFKKEKVTNLMRYAEEAKIKINEERQSELDRKSVSDVHKGVNKTRIIRNTLKKNNPDIINQEIEQCTNQCREKIEEKYKTKLNEQLFGNPDIMTTTSKFLGGKKLKSRKSKRKTRKIKNT